MDKIQVMFDFELHVSDPPGEQSNHYLMGNILQGAI
jgi:hypothetical protein